MVISIFLSLLLFIPSKHSLNNGLGLTPQMGWNSWNHFGCSINEIIVKKTVDAIVASGLANVGYEYINLDDCWQLSRDANGTIQADPMKFPSGIPALADYVHSKKLKFGLYSDRGNATCQKRPGSLHYETKDANTYAAWGVDYLKLDSCNVDNTPAEVEIGIMRDALNASGRSIFFSICGGVGGEPIAPTLGNSWRTTTDILDYWSSMMANIDHNDKGAAVAGPGGWNDPDMLEIGNGHMTDVEYQTHFSLWSLAKAPLLIGCDVTNMSATTLSILSNPEVIAVNQDKLGVQGKKIAFAASSSANASREIDVCQIDDPQALCQGKNQQWTYDSSSQTITSRMNGNCFGLLSGSGPELETFSCYNKTDQYWIWNATRGTFTNRGNHLYLSVKLEFEIWAGPLSGGSQAVVLLNRGQNNNERITVNWTDIGFPADHSATVRDLWARQDLGVFTGSFTSSNLDSHASMMLNITLTK